MSSTQPDDTTVDDNIEMWKMKKLIKGLENARGNGTSMISLIIPPKGQIALVNKMLVTESGTASNIKSRVNRLSVMSAIESTMQRLKLYNRVPNNGLVIFCGTILTDEGKEKKVNIDFEPMKPINTSLYLCDNKFHVEALSELLEDDTKYGFIVMDGSGTLFGTLAGNTREVIRKISVELPKKHGRGGQSALRFSRLREEARRNYIRKIAENAATIFITNDKVNCAGLILAGSADLKNELNLSETFDGRLKSKVIKVVDVSYGFENGFNQAIALTSETLSNIKYMQEKKLIESYFDEISQDTGKYCFGIGDTLKALEMGAVESLIVWEKIPTNRYVLRNASGAETVVHPTAEEEASKSFLVNDSPDPNSNAEMEVVDNMPLIDWFTLHYKEFGTKLEIITDCSQEGSQFVKGFGGIGGILRYRVNFEQICDSDDFISDDDDEYI
ncbi:eukaryotic peptide chain release factor subunit 1 [Parasitella parasitica]|nr:eukaryotic peptide chain release factor subunit 1 [Parasitella parasitica]